MTTTVHTSVTLDAVQTQDRGRASPAQSAFPSGNLRSHHPGPRPLDHGGDPFGLIQFRRSNSDRCFFSLALALI
jgi:hypothetical protein